MKSYTTDSLSSTGRVLLLQVRRSRGLWSLDGDLLTFNQILVFLILHAPLMHLFRNVPFLSTAHSLIILSLGLFCLMNDARPVRVAWVMAYIAGAEILWRGAGGALIWEYGKYSTLILCILLLIKFGRLRDIKIWPIFFIALLIPGIFIAPSFDRQAISFQLSGPITLAVANMAFNTMKFKKSDLQRLFLAMIAPTVSIAFLSTDLIFTGDITFSGGGSNEAVTGGIGANQIASALSFGATAAFFYAFMTWENRRVRNFMIAIAVFLLAIAVLTFSRAGLWNTLGALMVAVFFLMRDRLRRSRILTILTQLSIAAYFIIFPFLLNLTGGAVVDRFSDFDSTGRDKIVEIDYDLFLANPVFGVGVGQSTYYHIPYFGYAKPTHTEYSRLMAEHGSLGVTAMVLLALVTLYRFLSRRSPFSKSLSASMSVWCLLYMMHAATRMVAPSFVFGLAAARFLPEEEKSGKSIPALRNQRLNIKMSRKQLK
jgi:hypothetical protein